MKKNFASLDMRGTSLTKVEPERTALMGAMKAPTSLFRS
jgi:hypothetical protein